MALCSCLHALILESSREYKSLQLLIMSLTFRHCWAVRQADHGSSAASLVRRSTTAPE